jgi:low temperature requirement protein LtrA
MLAVAAAAITISDAFEGHQQGFAISFAIIQILITYLWWSVGLYDPSHKVFNKFYTFNYVAAFILLIVSIFTSYHTATILWIFVLLLNVTPSLTGARTIITVLKQRGQVFTASATLVERFGLFTIIVLAESILSTVSGIAEIKDKHPAAWIAFILGILIAFLLWSLYFDMTSEQETKKGYSYLQWLIFLHYPLLASLSMAGASIRVLVADMEGGTPVVKWIFCGSISLILFIIVGLAAIMQEEEEDRAYIRPVSRLLVIAGICILILPLAGNRLNTLIFLSIISLILLVPVFVGTRSWVKYKFFGKE